MKTLRWTLLAATAFFVTGVHAQDISAADSTGLPGDNFNLPGALDLFKKSASPEAFEKALNSDDNSINNLDLNGDNNIDYVRVVDHAGENAHALVLQAIVAENQFQDVAVIEIEKEGEQSAKLQIAGDEDLYGKNVYAEPSEEKASGGKGGPSPVMETSAVFVNVWFWPCVSYVYAPGYVVWVSPWYWYHYPGWFRPWHPRPWRWHHAQCMHYYTMYPIVHTHRVGVAHRIYTPHRSTSAVVKERYKASTRTNDKTGKTPAVKEGQRKENAPPADTRDKAEKKTPRRKAETGREVEKAPRQAKPRPAPRTAPSRNGAKSGRKK
jgi:hypothetical protein